MALSTRIVLTIWVVCVPILLFSYASYRRDPTVDGDALAGLCVIAMLASPAIWAVGWIWGF